MKKLLAITLSVVMLLGCVVFGAYAEEGTPVVIDPEEITTISAAENGTWTDNTPGNGSLGIQNYKGIDIVTEFRTGDTITFDVTVDEAGTYDFAIKFIWQWATTVSVAVDDGEAVEMTLNDFLEWTTATWSNPIQLEFTEGDHTITITHTMVDSGVHIEAIQFGPEGSIRDMTGCVYNAAYDVRESAMGGIAISYGYRMMINAPFDQFRIWMPTWNNPDSFCTIAFYKWEGNLDATIAEESIAEVVLDPMGGDAWRLVEFDEQEAGEYLVYIYDCGGAAGLYKVDADALIAAGKEVKGYTYIDGNEPSQIHVPHLRIYTVEPYTDGDLFGECTPDVYPPAPETTAPETTVAPETTAPETTAPETTAPETTAPETTAPETTVADTTVADTTAAATTAAGTEAGTAAGTGATGTKAPATTTAAAASEGCKAVVGSMSAIALVAIASAAAVVLKKKED